MAAEMIRRKMLQLAGAAVLSTPLVLLADGYQFIRRGDPDAAATANVCSVASASTALEAGVLSAATAGTALYSGKVGISIVIW